jgi:dTDP-4-dehydrorhamnose 3,5-epimerase
MEIIDLKPAFSDSRGTITDLIENGEIDGITVITFSPGAVRANHYHKKTVQWNYVLSGEILLVTQFPDGPRQERVLKKGDFAVTRELEHHALKGLTDAELMVFTKGPRMGSQYEQDTFRLEVPLIT